VSDNRNVLIGEATEAVVDVIHLMDVAGDLTGATAGQLICYTHIVPIR
jgi:hypothetical protein